MIKASTFCVNIPLWRLCQQASGETHTISRWSIYSTSLIIIICNIILWERKGYRIWNISDNVSFNMKNLEVCHRSHVTCVCRRCTWPGSTWSSCTSSPSPSSPSSTSWSTCQRPWYHLFPVFVTKTLSHFFPFALLYMSMMLQGDQEGHGNS